MTKKSKKQEAKVEEIAEEPISDQPQIQSDPKPLKMSFVKLAFTPFGIFIDNIKKTFVLSGFYAVILSVISLVMGFGYICKYNRLMTVSFYCSDSNVMFIIFSLLSMFALSIFTVKYYDLIFKKVPFSFKDLILLNKKCLHVFLGYLMILLSCFTPFLSLYLLFMRVPNPDWVIETAYFAVVSVGFLIPFLMMRFYSYINFFAEGVKAPSPKELWIFTSSNSLKILFSLMLIFVLFIFILFQFYVNFIKAVDESPIYVGIVSTFLYYFTVLMLFSIFINHCVMQKQIIYGSLKNE